MTDAEFIAWLRTGGRRTALVEVDTETPRYLSSIAYTTLPTDDPANRSYLPCVDGGVAFAERLSLTGTPSISVGDIEVRNDEGWLDDWLDDVWVNRAVRVYIGDVTWPREDFRLVFAGVTANLVPRSPGRLSIVLRSMLERLNTPVTEATLGGSTANADRILPITLGECHNVEPVLVDPASHEYQFHQGAAERIIEVRDNGVPVSKTELLSTGRFRLAASPAGTITASVQGDKTGSTYRNTVAGLVQLLATAYGTPSERLTFGDLDATSLAAFASAHTQPVGLYLADRANVLQCCQQLAASVGAQVVATAAGLLQLVKIGLPGTGTSIDITASDYEAGSLRVVSRPDVIAGVRLGYCRNWCVQEALDTGIPGAHKSLYAQAWMTKTVRDTAVAEAYRLYAEPQQVDTLLLRGDDADDEASRRLALWSEPRMVIGVRCYAHMLLLPLGQEVTLYGPRFGLAAGKAGQIVGRQADWMRGRIELEVLV